MTETVKRLLAGFLLLCCVGCLSACDSCSDDAVTVPFYRKVAREVRDDGWVFTFVYNGLKDPQADDSTLFHYQFFGFNIRYRYDDAYIQRETHSSTDGTSVTYPIVPPVLTWGTGSDAQARDMRLVETILDNSRTVEEILALSPEDYAFEELDGEMFFRLVRQGLTGEAQKEGTSQLYWDKPSYAFLEEPEFLDGYKFQIAFLQETGCVDVLFIDVQYRTGDGYHDYVQLSDLVENGTATAEQREAFALICEITGDIMESESFLAGSQDYKAARIGGIAFSRLYAFLNNIHRNQFQKYVKDPVFLPGERAGK